MNIIQLIEQFPELQIENSSIFILRHAEKPIANNMHEDIANTITDKGRKAAKTLGRNIKTFYSQIGIVRTSPIARCVATTNNIFSIYSKKLPIITDTTLGGDGAYVSNGELAAKHFLHNPSQKGIFLRIQRGESFAGMLRPEDGTKILLAKILEDLNNTSYPSFYITHDCILALFVNTLLDRIIDESNWFQFLEGICIKGFGGKLKLYWGVESLDITEQIKRLAL